MTREDERLIDQIRKNAAYTIGKNSQHEGRPRDAIYDAIRNVAGTSFLQMRLQDIITREALKLVVADPDAPVDGLTREAAAAWLDGVVV